MEGFNHLKKGVEEYTEFARNEYEGQIKSIKADYAREVNEKNEYKNKLDNMIQENEILKNENKALNERINSIPRWIVKVFNRRNQKALGKGE